MDPETLALRELGRFFAARRAQLQPADVGLPELPGSLRRVAGLRREEVARLVAISTDYYTRIEQGRLAPSAPVLDGMIRALRLDDEQADYVVALLARSSEAPGPRGSLASRSSRGARASRSERASRAVRPQIARLLGQLDHTPALVFGPLLDILAWNDLAAALLLDFAELPPKERNYIRLVFLHPRMRALYPEWQQVARTCVAVLRMNAAENPTDPALSALVGELSIASPEFRRWWAERRVAHQSFGTKVIRHPVAGDLTLDWDSFAQTGSPDQQLVLWSAEPGSASEARLRTLEPE